MNATAEPLEGSTVKITVTVPAADVDRAVAHAYSDVAAKVRIAGFRKGKVPRPVIDANVGREAVLAEAVEAIVGDTFPDAVEELGLIPIEPAEVDELDQAVEGTDYVYTADVRVRPEFTLSSTEGLSVEVEPAKATDEELDEQIDYLRDRFSSLEPVDDRGVEPVDFALISFTSTIDGEPYDNNEVDGLLYELGRGQMPQEFDDALLGARAGDEAVSEFTIPDTSSNPEFVGKSVRFEIKVSEVKAKVLPDVDDEFAASVGGFESVDQLRDDVRTRIEQARDVARSRKIEQEGRKALAERLEGDIPDEIVAAKKEEMLGEFQTQLMQREMTLEAYMEQSGATEAQIEADVAEEAAVRVREDLALEALFRAEGLEIGEGEMDAQIAAMAERYEMEPDTLRTTLRNRVMLPDIRQQLMHRHATGWLMDNVEVVEVPRAVDTSAVETAEPAADKPAGKKKPAAKKAPEPAAEAPAAEDVPSDAPETEADASADDE